MLDIDTIDNQIGGTLNYCITMRRILNLTIPESLRMFANTFSSIIGAIVLISIILPWFLIPVALVAICYVYASMFYRASARELKVNPLSATCESSVLLITISDRD